jgi:hypothetical protein
VLGFSHFIIRSSRGIGTGALVHMRSMQNSRLLRHAKLKLFKFLTFFEGPAYKLRFKNEQISYPVMYLNGNSPIV